MSDPVSRVPLVSVIMPTYNHARFIGESIVSVLSQSYNNLELIIVDNYSSDDSEGIVRRFAQGDPRIRYIKFHNQGVIANSRNRGLAEAMGEFIAFIDSDDVWHTRKLEWQVPLFVKNSVGYVYGRAKTIDENGIELDVKDSQLFYEGDLLVKLLQVSVSVPQSSLVVRRDVLKRYNLYFRSNRQGAEDFDFLIRVAEVSDAAYTDKVVMYYRTHAGAISRNHCLLYNSSMVTIDEYESYVRNRFTNDHSRRKRILRACDIFRTYTVNREVHFLLRDGFYHDAFFLALGRMKGKPFQISRAVMCSYVFVYVVVRCCIPALRRHLRHWVPGCRL